MNQVRFLTLLLICVPAAECLGSDAPCQLLAHKAVAAQASMTSPDRKPVESQRDNPLHQGRAAERLAYILATCPEQSFRTIYLLGSTDWLSAWGRSLRATPTLQPGERATLIAGAKWAAGSANNRLLAQSVRKVLQTASGAAPQRLDPSCGPMFRHLLIGLVDDWMARSGAQWFDHSDSLLFMMASCPDDFYFVMNQRPEVLHSWLKELPKASFWGEAKVTAQLQALREALVELVRAQNMPLYLRPTHDEILARLGALCVTAVDQASPCPSQPKD